MPNTLDQNGLQIQTIAEILDEILNGTTDYPGMYQIYGTDINVDPNSPDGQFINIFAQAKRDMLELIQQVYTSMDPDQAVGVALDQRCTINGVVRNAGTYTIQNAEVTVTQAITLLGLDTSPTAPFTVSDAAGNQFYLVATTAFVGAGTQTLVFRAANLGVVQTTLNTITTIVTITLGVASVNNPAAATSVGTAEESDYALRIRRSKSVALPSQGYFDGLYGALLDASGVTSVNLLENTSSTPDANGIPGHSIWAIVAGGTNLDIASILLRKRNAGCGMKGGTTVNVTLANGSVFPVHFDRPTAEPLYISFNIVAISGTVDPTYIRNQILSHLSYNIGEVSDASAITALVKDLAPNGSVSVMGVSEDGVTYVQLLTPLTVDKQFTLDQTRIIINGSHP